MVRYRVVDRSHPICGDVCPDNIHHFMKKFWSSRNLEGCDGAIIATKGEQLVAFFRFYKYNYPTELWGAGTYVLSEYRSQGVAKRLWAAAIKEVDPSYIHVTATSKGAIKLLNALKARYTNIRWGIERSGV